MSFKVPNHTQTPNELFDVHMKDMDMAELKVVLVICRKTFGWRKQYDRISLSQLEDLTGMSRTSVIKGIQQGIGRGVIERFACDDGFEYGLVVEDTSTENVPLASTEIEHTKESILKKHTGGDFLTASLKNKPPTFDDYPIEVQPYCIAFHNKFKRIPSKEEKPVWIKAFLECREKGIKPSDIAPMYAHCKEKGLAIKSPFSITFAFDELRSAPPTTARKGK